VVVEDAERGEVGWGDCAAGVVGEALVALGLFSQSFFSMEGGGVCTSSLSNQYALIFADCVIELKLIACK
jgi:hypothetical protein